MEVVKPTLPRYTTVCGRVGGGPHLDSFVDLAPGDDAEDDQDPACR